MWKKVLLIGGGLTALGVAGVAAYKLIKAKRAQRAVTELENAESEQEKSVPKRGEVIRIEEGMRGIFYRKWSAIEHTLTEEKRRKFRAGMNSLDAYMKACACSDSVDGIGGYLLAVVESWKGYCGMNGQIPQFASLGIIELSLDEIAKKIRQSAESDMHLSMGLSAVTELRKALLWREKKAVNG